MEKKDEKVQNKRFAIAGLVVAVIVNFIFNEPIVHTFEEFARIISGNILPQTVSFFFENLLIWLMITLIALFGTFALLKAGSIQAEQNKKEYNEKKEKSDKLSENYKSTKKLGNHVSFDDNRKKWATLNNEGFLEKIYDYDDIVNFELLEDGNSVASGGLGRALVGGILFGGAGAVVGGVTGRKKTKNYCESLKLKVTVDDINNPSVYINFINEKTKKNSDKYKEIAEAAQDCLSTFQVICDRREKMKAQEGN